MASSPYYNDPDNVEATEIVFEDDSLLCVVPHKANEKAIIALDPKESVFFNPDPKADQSAPVHDDIPFDECDKLSGAAQHFFHNQIFSIFLFSTTISLFFLVVSSY